MTELEQFATEQLDGDQPSATDDQEAVESVSKSDSADAPSDMDLFEQYLDSDEDFDVPNRGDLREGTIVEVRSNELLINIGVKRDGVVPQADLARLEKSIVESFEVGQTIAVAVSRTGDDGAFTLSISEALQQKDWVEAQNLLESGESTMHKVIGYNKGGLTVEFNSLRGFVPASHVVDMPRNLTEEQRRTEFESRIDVVMRLKVIEVERRRRRLVMSQMLAEREYRNSRKEELFRTLSVGDVLDGEVRGMRPFGAFIDIGGADGLLHVSEISWAPVAHPQNELERGQKIQVQVIRLNPEKQQIALSRKRLLENPWESVDDRYKSGDIVPAKITRVVDFGAFAQLESGVEGLIHISELADISIAEPLKTVQAGDEVDVKILRVDSRRQRVGLSLRQAIGVLVPEDTSDNIEEPVSEELAADEASATEEMATEESTVEVVSEEISPEESSSSEGAEEAIVDGPIDGEPADEAVDAE